MAPKKTKPKSKAKRPPKAAPVTKVKTPEIEGPRPLSKFDYDFCAGFVRTGKQVQAYRELMPDAKDPHRAAFRMMERPEIREHIREIFKHISAERHRAAKLSARSTLLSLEVADDRLMELMEQPRKTRAEMFTKDTKQVFTPHGLREGENVMPPAPEGETAEEKAARLAEYDAETEARRERDKQRTDVWLQAPAPIEDADLLKAIKLTYERKQGIVKAEKPPEVTAVTMMLYKPKWFGSARPAPMIEGQA